MPFSEPVFTAFVPALSVSKGRCFPRRKVQGALRICGLFSFFAALLSLELYNASRFEGQAAVS